MMPLSALGFPGLVIKATSRPWRGRDEAVLSSNPVDYSLIFTSSPILRSFMGDSRLLFKFHFSYFKSFLRRLYAVVNFTPHFPTPNSSHTTPLPLKSSHLLLPLCLWLTIWHWIIYYEVYCYRRCIHPLSTAFNGLQFFISGRDL